ncbi:MAG TPA: extracellular solute-binding protein [Limnochordia bacterium]
MDTARCLRGWRHDRPGCAWGRHGALVGLAVAALVLWALPAAAAVRLTLMGAYPKGGADAAGTILEEYVQEYQRLHPDVEIVRVPRTGTDQEAMEKIYVSIAAGVPPDVVFIPQVFLTDYVARGVVQPVPRVYRSRIAAAYLPGALQLATYQGELYGFPTESQPQALAYNAAVFSQAGLPDAPPATWEELRTLARKLTRRQADGELVRAGYGILTYATPISAYVLSYSRAHGDLPIQPDLRRVNFSGAGSVAAVEFLRILYREDQTAVLEMEGFTENRLGMFFAHGPWQAAGFRSVGEAFYEGLRSAVPPRGSTGTPQTTFYGYLWAVTPYTREIEAAYRFLFWLCTEVTEKGTTRMGDVLEALGSIPNTSADASNQPSMKEPFMQGFLQGVVTGAAKPIPAIPAWLESFGELTRRVNEVLEGKMPARQAMSEVDRFIQAKLDAYYAR